jgi:hypothetical protein
MANVTHIGIDTSSIKRGVKGSRVGTGKSFDTALATMGAVGDTLGAAGIGSKPAAVISAAFSGMQAGATSFGGGYGAGLGGTNVYASAGIPGMDGLTGISGSSTDAVVPGTEGFTQADMINTMNANNLKLLELQALMQSNMQAWNTKSNILNADHRVKTTMIEKLSPR